MNDVKRVLFIGGVLLMIILIQTLCADFLFGWSATYPGMMQRTDFSYMCEAPPPNLFAIRSHCRDGRYHLNTKCPEVNSPPLPVSLHRLSPADFATVVNATLQTRQQHGTNHNTGLDEGRTGDPGGDGGNTGGGGGHTSYSPYSLGLPTDAYRATMYPNGTHITHTAAQRIFSSLHLTSDRSNSTSARTLNATVVAAWARAYLPAKWYALREMSNVDVNRCADYMCEGDFVYQLLKCLL